MIDYWRGLRSGPEAPSRADFDPAQVSNLLPQTFMVDRQSGLPLRLAGGLMEDLHGRSLRRESFLGLWSAESRAAVRDAAVAALRGPEPAVLYAHGQTESNQQAGLEITLAPLVGREGRVDRLLGFYQPVTTLVRLHGEALSELSHKLTIYAGQGEIETRASHLRLAAVDGRRIA